MIYYIDSKNNNGNKKIYESLESFYDEYENEQLSTGSILLVICDSNQSLDNNVKEYVRKEEEYLGILKVAFLFYYEQRSDFENFENIINIFKKNNVSFFIASLNFQKSNIKFLTLVLENTIINFLFENKVLQGIYIPFELSCARVNEFNLSKQIMMYYLKNGISESVNFDDFTHEYICERIKEYIFNNLKKVFKVFDEIDCFKYFLINEGPAIDSIFLENISYESDAKNFEINKKNLETFEKKYGARLDLFLEFNCEDCDETIMDIEELLNRVTNDAYSHCFGNSRLDLYEKFIQSLSKIVVTKSLYRSAKHPKLDTSNNIFTYINDQLCCVGNNYICGEDGYEGYKKSEYENDIIDKIRRELNLKYNLLKRVLEETKIELNEDLTKTFTDLLENYNLQEYSDIKQRIKMLNKILNNEAIQNGIFENCIDFSSTLEFIDSQRMLLTKNAIENFKTAISEYIETQLNLRSNSIKILLGANPQQIYQTHSTKQIISHFIPKHLKKFGIEGYDTIIDENSFGRFKFAEIDYGSFNDVKSKL